MSKKRCYLYNFPSLKGEPRIKEPSVLYAVPDKRKWDSEFVFDGAVKPDGDLYLCSVFTCGYPDFLDFSKKTGPERIIAGGYHPSLCPGDFAGRADKIVAGFGNDIDAIIKSGQKGVIKGKFRYNHMDRSVFPLEELKEAWYAGIFPGQRSLSISTFMGCPFPCDFSDNCCNFSTYGARKIFYPLAYIKEELKLLAQYPHDFLFIRDEGFFLHPEFREIVKLLGRTGRKIYSFLGPLGGLDEGVIRFLKDNNWFCLTFGFNIHEGYTEDRESLRVAALAHKRAPEHNSQRRRGREVHLLPGHRRKAAGQIPAAVHGALLLDALPGHPVLRAVQGQADHGELQAAERPQLQVGQPAGAEPARKSALLAAGQLL